MRNKIAIGTTIAVVAATLPGAPSALAVEGPAFDEFQAGMESLGVWLGDLASIEELNGSVPLTALDPTGPDGLNLRGIFDDPDSGGVEPWVAAAQVATNEANLITGLEGITDPDVDVQIAITPTTAAPDADATWTLTIDLAREVDAPLAVVDLGQNIDVQSQAGDPGVPLDLHLSIAATLNVKELTGSVADFWLDADPTITFDALTDANDDDVADTHSFDGTLLSRVGIIETVIADTSTVTIDKHVALPVTDHDGNGRLAFRASAADVGESQAEAVPGELQMPKDANITPAVTVANADGVLDIAIAGTDIAIAGGGPFAPQVTITNVGGTPTFSANQDYTGNQASDPKVQGLAAFTSIDATELLGGLGQLSNLIGIVQRDPRANVDIPFLDVDLADMTGITDDLNGFIVASTLNDNPTTVLNEFGIADFDGDGSDVDTLQEFIAAIGTTAGLSLGSMVFDPATGGLDLPLTLSRDETGAPVQLQARIVDPVNFQIDPTPIGRPSLGDALDADLGITGVSGFVDTDGDGEFDTMPDPDPASSGLPVLVLPPATTTVERVFDVTIPWGVDLTPSVACDPVDCDLPTTPDFLENETLPVYQRFFLKDLADNAPEITFDMSSVTGAANLRGTAGYVDLGITPGPTSQLLLDATDATADMLTINLTYPGDLPQPKGFLPLQTFSFHLTFEPSDGVGDLYDGSAPFLAVAHDVNGAGTLHFQAIGVGNTPIPILGSVDLPVNLTWTALKPVVQFISPDGGVTPPAETAQALVVGGLPADLAALSALNFAPETPDNPFPDEALFASIVDTLGAVTEGLQSALSAGGFGDEIPLLGKDAGDLFPVFDQLDQYLTDIRSAGTPTRLRDLLEGIDGILNIDESKLAFIDLGDDGVLDLVLSFAPSIVNETTSVNLALTTGDVPFVGASTGGQIDVTVDAGAELTIPIALSVTDGVLDPADVSIDDSSGLSIQVEAQLGNDGSVTVSALGQDLTIGSGGPSDIGGEFKVAAGGSLSTGGTEGDYVSLATFAGALTGSFGAIDGGVTCAVEGTDPAVTTEGDLLCAILPVYINDSLATTADPTTANAYLRTSVDDFSTWSVDLPDGLADAIAAEFFSFESLQDIFQSVINLIRALMKGTGLDLEVPALGDALDGVEDIAAELEALLAPLDSALALNPETAYATTAINDALAPVKQALADTDILREHLNFGANGGTVDVVHRAYCDFQGTETECSNETYDHDGDGDDEEDVSPEIPKHPPASITKVELAFVLGGGDAVGGTPGCVDLCVELPFDLGLPGVDFVGVDGSLEAGTAWLVKVGVGISKDDGPYLIPNPETILDPENATSHPDIEDVEVLAYAGLGDQGIETRLGLLSFILENREGETSDVSIDGSLDLAGTDPITIVQIPGLLANPIASFNPDISISADFNSLLSAEVPGTSGMGLPRISADFDFEWGQQIIGGSVEDAPDGDLYFGLTNVVIDLGAIFDEFFGPIFGQLNDVVEVADDVRAFVFAPIPVLSELSRMFGGGDVTFVDLAELFGDVDLSLLEDINDVLDFISLISSVGDGTLALNDLVGSEVAFVYDSSKILQPEAPSSQASSVVKSQAVGGDGKGNGTPQDVPSMANDLQGVAGGGSEKVIEEGGNDDFKLPIFDNPECILTMIAKGDCVILEWTPEELYIEFEYEQPFGPFFGVLYITIGGYAGAGAKFGMGFSTRGIRRAVETSLDNGFTPDLLGNMIVEGIYIVDFEGPELYVKAGITAGAKLDIFILEAGVKGGIEATLGFDLIDGPEIDGKVYLDEMAARIFNPLCLFEVVGFLEAFLKIYVEIGPCPFCYEEEFELARVRLLDFTLALAECDQDPVLAKEKTGDGSEGVFGLDHVELIMGPTINDRKIYTDKHDESFVIREIVAPDITIDGNTATGNSPGVFEVSAFGHTQRYEGYWISFDSGQGDDVLLFQGSKAQDKSGESDPGQSGSVQGDGEDYGSQDPDKDEAPFTAWVKGNLGTDDDAITTGDGNDVISAVSGKNTIATGRGDDTVNGGSEADTIDLGFGTDTGHGNGGNDSINGGPGGDTLNGGAGDDRLEGGSTIVGPSGTPVPGGEDLVDTINGGDNADTIFGGPENDVLNGDGGADIIHGQTGSDIIHGGEGNDLILGDETDVPTDEPAEDDIWGDGGNDLILGAWQTDEIHGGDGDDFIVGDDGADVLNGDGGDDKIYGDRIGAAWKNFATANIPTALDLSEFLGGLGTPGNDIIDGGDDDDTIEGQEGDDRINGGAHDDTINGGDGRDFINGDDEPILGAGGFATWHVDQPTFPGDCTPTAVDGADATDGEDTILGGEGDDTINGEGAKDNIRGGGGNDLIFGNAGPDDLYGDNGEDEIYGGANSDTIEGGPDNDLLVGNQDDDDPLTEDIEGDRIYGQAGDDRMIGGNGHQRQCVVEDGGDKLWGGYGDDLGIGDNGQLPNLSTVNLGPNNAADDQFGDDWLVGDQDRDTLHGQQGNDTVIGGDGQDQLFGELGDDVLLGQQDEDYLFGDQARVGLGVDGLVTAEKVARDSTVFWPGGAPKWAVQLVEPNAGGEDFLAGMQDDDHMYGGAADDTLVGDNFLFPASALESGDDWMEGNGGEDSMHGDKGQDDMIGGSSDVNPLADKLDEGETVMDGGDDQDVMIGDNGEINRLTNEAGTEWAPDPITQGRARVVTLYDRERRTPASLDPVSGPDYMLGGSGNDRMWGEGDDDLLKGQADDDQMFGNQGRDILEGNGGDDDLIGGHNESAKGLPGVPAGVDDGFGDPDDRDWLFGGDGEDVLLGDNGIITREHPVNGLPSAPAPFASYYHVTSGTELQRGINLLDLATFTDANSGPDQVSGGAGTDVMFGQDENDALSGGPADDYQEGNGHSDALIGDRYLSEVTGLPLTPVVSLLAQYGIPDPVTSISIQPIGDSGHPLLANLSGVPALEGLAGTHGQDDQIGGSSKAGHRDTDDILVGDGHHDFQLGDNGLLVRSFDGLGNPVLFADYNNAIKRADTQYDIGPDPSQGDDRSDNDLTSGNDWLQGNDGDDAQWGQDGHDVIFGDAGNDDQYGELDWDRMFGGSGEDVMLGDRGDVVNKLILDPAAELFYDTQGPAFFVYEGLKVGQLDRRVDLILDADGSTLAYHGHQAGGRDYMRGGDDHDSMHGGFGNDWMNGDSGGDWLFGDDGNDAMWGGGGLGGDATDHTVTPLHDTDPDDSHFESLVDFIIGGHGADVLDFRPRPEGVPGHTDEPIWRVITGLADVDYSPDVDNSEPNQHHQGVDWILGGFDRDVLQGNVGKNGPDLNDRLIDMVGAFNLYTRCNESYGDDGDIRQRDPALEEFWHTLAYGSGAGKSVQDVFTPGSSAYRELGWVYKGKEGAGNNGSAHDGTPGHFFNTACGAP